LETLLLAARASDRDNRRKNNNRIILSNKRNRIFLVGFLFWSETKEKKTITNIFNGPPECCRFAPFAPVKIIANTKFPIAGSTEKAKNVKDEKARDLFSRPPDD
jgi:hypothetical protein